MISEHIMLLDWFKQNAVVTDIKKGYIVVSKLNIVLDTEMLKLITAAWAVCFADLKVDAIVGLPDAAGRLISPLAIALQIPIILPAKKRSYPKGWEGLGNVVEYAADSFTGPTQEVTKAFIGGIQKDMRVLVIDDVAATGAVGTAAIHAMQNAGVNIVGMGVIFDKAWQGGVERIVENTGVNVCSLITVEQIYLNGEIKLREENKKSEQ